MKVPPIILPPVDSAPDGMEKYPAESGASRNYIGWVALLLMFLLVLASALTGSASRSKDAKFLEYDQRLKSIIKLEQRRANPIPGFATLDDEDPKIELKAIEKELAGRNDLDNFGRAIYAAVLTEEKKTVPPQVYRPLQKGVMDSTRALGTIYSTVTLTVPQARALKARLVKSELFVSKLAGIHALEKAGQKNLRKQLAPERSPLLTLAILAATAGIFIGCIVVWFCYWQARGSGYLHPMGLLNERLTLAQADLFAVRAAQLFAGFLFLSQLMEFGFGKASSNAGPALFQSFLMLAFVGGLTQVPLGRGKLSFADLGIRKEHFGIHVLWGFAGFLAELPLAILLSVVVTSLLKFLPTPEHPASQQLQMNHDPMTVLSILVLGTIVAPIWEEIMFRGLLFPALSRVCKSVPIGAIASSLIFASIHPQGMALWLALGTTGLMSCALTYQTKSLVPSIVMHFCHNATLMVLTILIS